MSTKYGRRSIMFNWIMTNTPSMLNQLWPKIESSITTNSKL
jgi:hypothetical protein